MSQRLRRAPLLALLGATPALAAPPDQEAPTMPSTPAPDVAPTPVAAPEVPPTSCHGAVQNITSYALTIGCDGGATAVLGFGPDEKAPGPDLPFTTTGTFTWTVDPSGNRVWVAADLDNGKHVTPVPADMSCFVSTAVAHSRGLPDDCEELELLRHFRDTYLAGHADVAAYYRLAPGIVAAVQRRPDADRIWRAVYEGYLVPILAMIRAGRHAEAHNAYRLLVEDLGGVSPDGTSRA